MKKMIFFSIIALFLCAIIPNVHAVTGYGTVKDITKDAGDSLTIGTGTLTTKGNTTTIQYSTATFKMLEADSGASSGNRPGPAAWIGFKVTEPTSDNNSSFKVTTPSNKTEQIKSSSYEDYVGITPTNLKNALLKGTPLTYKYSFDWDEDGDADQYVIIKIDPETTTLKSTDGREDEWSPKIADKILQEQNPETSDIPLLPLVGIIILGGCGLIYCVKKA